MSDTNNCPVCGGPASIGYRAASTNPAMCGMHGWTADCNAGCDGAPYVSRFTRDAARDAWNELTKAKEPSMTNDTKQATPPAMNAASPTDSDLCALEYAVSSLRAIAERSEVVGDVIEPMNDIRAASRRARAALTRLEPVAQRAGRAAPVGQGSAKSEAEKMLAMRADYDRQSAAKRGTLAGQGSATSGEAIKTWRERAAEIDPAYLTASLADISWSVQVSCMHRENADLRAALAASAEQSNSAGAARDEQAEDMAFLMTGHRDRSGDCFKVLGKILFDAGYHKGSPPVAERAAAPASVPEGNELPCPACGGSGEVSGLCGGGMDAYEVSAICPHCNGTGGLNDAYRGVCALLAAEQEKYLAACGKLYFAAPEVAQPAAQGESQQEALVAKLERVLMWASNLPATAEGVTAAKRQLHEVQMALIGGGKSLATPAPTAGEASTQKGGA